MAKCCNGKLSHLGAKCQYYFYFYRIVWRVEEQNNILRSNFSFLRMLQSKNTCLEFMTYAGQSSQPVIKYGTSQSLLNFSPAQYVSAD